MKIEAFCKEGLDVKYDQEECRLHVITATSGSSLVSATCLAAKHTVENVRLFPFIVSGCVFIML